MKLCYANTWCPTSYILGRQYTLCDIPTPQHPKLLLVHLEWVHRISLDLILGRLNFAHRDIMYVYYNIIHIMYMYICTVYKIYMYM